MYLKIHYHIGQYLANDLGYVFVTTTGVREIRIHCM